MDSFLCTPLDPNLKVMIHYAQNERNNSLDR